MSFNKSRAVSFDISSKWRKKNFQKKENRPLSRKSAIWKPIRRKKEFAQKVVLKLILSMIPSQLTQSGDTIAMFAQRVSIIALTLQITYWVIRETVPTSAPFAKRNLSKKGLFRSTCLFIPEISHTSAAFV